MAMSNCKECGKAVSTLAKTCPSCGVPKPAKVLKKKTSTKKNIIKSKKEKPNVLSTKKTSKEEYVYNPNTGSYDKKSKKIKKESSYDSKTGYNPKTGSFERESKKDKVDDLYIKQQELVKKEIELLEIENKRRISNEEEQERREQRQRTARQEAINYQTKVSNQKRDTIVSSPVKTTPGNNDIFDKFNNSTLDLATAFWGFGVFGSIIVGVVCGVLTEMVGWFFNIPYVILTFLIIIGVWECAENYKKEMNKKSESVVWGVLTQVFCVFSGIGLAGFVFELF